MRKNRIFSFGIGTTSILMIFIIISLTVISLLSYMVTVKDLRLTDKKGEYVQKYQSADNLAVEKLVQIDDKLVQMRDENVKFSSDKAKKILEDVKDINIDYQSKMINYYVLLNDRSYLYVELKINTNKDSFINKKNRINVQSWKLVSKSQNIEEENLELWMN